MRVAPPNPEAPRPRSRVGALVCHATCAASALLVAASVAAAQEPPDRVLPLPDSIAPDSVAMDSLQVQAAPDSVSADTIFYNPPEFDGRAPSGWSTGVWSWDFEAIHASAANTLYELIADVPGVIVLLGGDYGTPTGVSAFGSGGGSVRIFRDGFEVYALSGGIPDLARVGLAGIRLVRLERGLGELRIELFSKLHEDGRPFSLVEAGTGDLETNLFRGTFMDPVALGGSAAVALERTDTRGPQREEPGSRTGSWLRYQLHRGNNAGLAFDLRKMSVDSDLETYPAKTSRTDWTVRGRARFGEGVVTELYTGKASHTVDDIRDRYEREGGTRTQHGLRIGVSSAGLWGRGEYRLFRGANLPANRLDLSLGASRPSVGGVDADLSRASWDEESTSAQRLRAWTEPIGGILSFFGSYESGTYGSRLQPLLDIEPPADTTVVDGEEPEPEEPFDPGRLFGLTERSGTRIGAALTWRGASVSGALLEAETDTFIPLGLVPDRGGPLLPGISRKGWEIWGSIPMPMQGLRLEGSLQQWDEPGPYLPGQIYRGALVFHRTYLESGNFEWWWTIGVRGHDPMTLPLLGEADEEPVEGEEASVVLQTAPFYQNWYARIQIRVVTFQLYVAWENFTRRDSLQHYPGRVLPITRTVYGIRWTMFN